ncbi:unnamed protein product [Diatraea saccharalis]|uniref:Alpha-1,3-mannosyl-glycoprotein 2-beta-N-acetylglucosaminyltransferase n=1 Tax=Diatraea saccharalis TaxID=40085 RepID=A0A9N9RDB8_9NEOP|nr:unnamed protein product [Diatraea saccharalis]
MRVNYKRLTVAGAILVITYVLLTYSSVMDVPGASPRNNVKILSNRLNNLQKQMDEQMTNSNKLLQQVKQHLNLKSKKRQDEEFVQENELDSPNNLVLPVLLIACDRVTVKRCLDNLVKFRPNKETFPIVVSQDCGHNATYQVIRSFADADPTITVVQQPDLSEIPLPRVKARLKHNTRPGASSALAPPSSLFIHIYIRLSSVRRSSTRGSRVYSTPCTRVKTGLPLYNMSIDVLDDLDISQDFFEYFLGTYPLLLKDPSLWCISAWNDNGKKDVIDLSHPELLHRTDFFPGLGWTLRKNTWLDLEPKWPEAFFDDWLRDPENTKGRACIRPEVSRTFTFGKIGVSKGLFYDMHLKAMQLNMEYVEFTKLDLSYLLKDNYDVELESKVDSLPEMTAEEVITSSTIGELSPVRVTYSNAKTYQKAAKKLGLMDDFRSGVPRTAYKGIVSCFVRGRRVYLAPSFPWTKYDPNWG